MNDMSDIQFFDFAAEAGLTKHLGGLETTDELIEKCKITSNFSFLYV